MKIKKAFRDGDTKEIKMEIEWKYDKTQKFTPLPSEYTNTDIKNYNKDIILEFYESKITFKGTNTNN